MKYRKTAPQIVAQNLAALGKPALGPQITFAIPTAPPDGAVDHLDPKPLASPAFYRVTAP